MEKYSEPELRMTSIFVLRNIARRVGVVSPTTYKKDDLVKKVCDIVSGRAQPEMPRNRQGRPPKDRVNQFLLLEQNNGVPGVPKDEIEILPEYYVPMAKKDEKLDASADDGNIFFDGEDLPDEGEHEGYLVDASTDRWFLFPGGHATPKRRSVFLSTSLMSAGDIRPSDYVKCSYKLDRNWLNVDKVLSKPEGKRPWFSSISRIRESQWCNKPEIYKVGNFDLKEGERVLISTKTVGREADIFEQFDKVPTDATKLALRLDVLEDYGKVDYETFWTMAGDSERRNYFSTKLLYGRIKRLVEKGKRVLVYVSELSKLARYFNLTHGYSAWDLKEGTLSFCLGIMQMAGYYNNGASVTVLGLLKESEGQLYSYIERDLVDYNCKFITEENILGE